MLFAARRVTFRRQLTTQPRRAAEGEGEIWTDRLAKLDARKVKRWVIGTAVPVLAMPLGIALLPGLGETRRGLRLGLSYPANNVQVAGSDAWQLGIGGVGLMGGFGAASGYITKHAARLGPVFSAFRAPWACFGAVLGSQLCYQLAPTMMEHSLIISKTAAFVVDGLEADVLGKGGQREWEKEAELVEGRSEAFFDWAKEVWASQPGAGTTAPAPAEKDATAPQAAPAAAALPAKRPAAVLASGASATSEKWAIQDTAQKGEAEWRATVQLCKRLTLLRKEEQEVKSDMAQLLKAGSDSSTGDGTFGASGGPPSSVQMEMADRLLALSQQKQRVKDEAAANGVRSLDAFARGDLKRSKVELSQARRRQVELAQKLRATRHTRGDHTERRNWNRELHALEARKAELKARAKSAHGNAKLGREARSCTRWQQVLDGTGKSR